MADPRLCVSRVEDDCLFVGIVNDIASLDAGQRVLRTFLADQGLSKRATFQTELAFEELVTNVIRHAYTGRAPSRYPIDAVVRVEASQIVLTVEDEGPPFDPVQAPELPLATSLEEAKVGGLGIRFIRAAATRIAHERVAHKNRVTVWLSR